MWAARCAWPSKPTLQVGSEGAKWGDALLMGIVCLNALLDPSSAAQIKFVPNSALPIGTTNVTLTTAITDDAGNALATEEVWSFTTILPCAP